jgi:iron complex outermembrane receptor protein
MTKIKLSILASALLVSSLGANDNFASATIISMPFENTEMTTASSTEIYTSTEIKKSHANNVYQFLNEQTTITTLPSYGNPYSQQIDLRGYGITNGYENIVITVDGRRLNNIDMAPQLLSAISIDNIEQIEIIKGSGSVVYGDGATAGVINIVTKGQSNNYIKAYQGNNGTKYRSISLGYTANDIIINAMSDYYTTDGEKKDNSYSKNKLINIQYFPNDDLELRAKRTFSNINVKYANSLTLNEFNNDIQKDKGFTEQIFNSYVTSLGSTYNINQNISIDIDFNDEDKLSEYSSGFKSNYRYRSTKSKLNITKDNFKVVLGLEKFNGDRIGSSNTTTKNNEALFISSDYKLTKNTKISSGVRYEEVEYRYSPNTSTDIEDNEYLMAYDIGFNHSLNNSQSIFINYNKAFQAPDIDRFFKSTWVNNGGNWTQTTTFNSFINPSISKTLNIGFNDIQDNNKLKTTIFRTNLTNEIYYYKTGARSGINTNIDKSHKYGLEVYDKYKFNDNYYTSLNYSYIIAKIDNENEANGAYNGKNLPGVSKHNITVDFGFNINKYSGVLSHKYRSDAYASEDLSNSFLQKQKAYNSTNLTLSYRYSQDIEIFAKAENIFNKKNGLWIADDKIYPVNYTTTFYVGMKASF